MSLLRAAILSWNVRRCGAGSRRDRAEDKNRTEVLGARVVLYIAAKKWDMAAAVASHLVKVDPETAGWWISLAYALRRTESIERRTILL